MKEEPPTYSYIASHHIEEGSNPSETRDKVRETRDELFSTLKKKLKQAGFKHKGMWSSEWLKENWIAKHDINEHGKKPLFAKKSWKPKVTVSLVWSRGINDDSGLKNVVTWLESINN